MDPKRTSLDSDSLTRVFDQYGGRWTEDARDIATLLERQVDAATDREQAMARESSRGEAMVMG